jgi:hypothetical protein
MAGLAQQNGFGPSFLHILLRLVKRKRKAWQFQEKSVNKCDLTAAPCFFNWPIIMIGPGGLLLVVFHLFAVSVLVLWVGLEKSK